MVNFTIKNNKKKRHIS